MNDEFDYIAPGLLLDGELQLVAASKSWLNDVMAAQQHPLTRQDMPAEADITRQRHLDFLDQMDHGFHPGIDDGLHPPTYYFWMRQRRAVDYPIAGAISLRLGRDANIERVIGHVGYHVYPFARGHHYAERACRLVAVLARRHGLMSLWITCNPDNLASRRTCERLGAKLIDIVPVPQDHPLFARGKYKKCRYRW